MLGTAVLDGGMRWTPLVMNNKDAQFLETRKFQLDEVARIYRIPPHMLANLERATFSNIEHQGIEFVALTLMPWLRRWEMALKTQVLDTGTSLYPEFLLDALLRGATLDRFQAYQLAIMNGVMNPNEARAKENMPPRPGGDEFRPAASLYGYADTNKDSGNEPSQAA